jgi:hypothetical protein
MIWLLITTLAAWAAYRFAANSDLSVAPKVAWWATISGASSLLMMSARFAVMERGIDFAAEYMPIEPVGLGTLFIPVINFFIWLGPIGCALGFGALGLWVLRGAFTGGWYRVALLVREERSKRLSRK